MITIRKLLLDWNQNGKEVLEVKCEVLWREMIQGEAVGKERKMRIRLNLGVCFCHALFQVKL